MFSILTLHLVTYEVKEQNEHGGLRRNWGVQTFLFTLFSWKTFNEDQIWSIFFVQLKKVDMLRTDAITVHIQKLQTNCRML